MATLVLGTLGTLAGGPLGGAIGGIIGRQIDGKLIGSGSNEGPRLKDLAVTTSSYGTPIPRHYGRMRAAGTIIWATDLIESRETSGGGKSRPSTTTFSYRMSFAVALSSRPINGVGRIWADGNLLRGAAGDLKAGGAFRLYTGRGDQLPDPVIAAAEGARCPAFRNCAYCVFEDLDLADFGNRVPALTFEIIADSGDVSLAHLVEQIEAPHSADVALINLEGFSYEGGALASTLAVIDSLYPFVTNSGGEALSLQSADFVAGQPAMLPQATSAWDENDFGGPGGWNRSRSASNQEMPEAVRYYDVGRDFQPGIQRADGRARPGRTRTIEFPGAMAADNARALANSASRRANSLREKMAWRIAELDPSLAPGTSVRAPGIPGTWRVAGWEWREKGVELDLVKLPSPAGTAPVGDTGKPAAPIDILAGPTLLRAFELPWDGRGSSGTPAMFAAASSPGSNWAGAALYLEVGGTLQPLPGTGRNRSVMGYLVLPLGPSKAVLLEKNSLIEVEIAAGDPIFAPATAAALADGANRMLVGNEVVQFAAAEQVQADRWMLRGLLRGRGGTELAAQLEHPVGTPITLIDQNLVPLDAALVPNSETTSLAAIGRGDDAPVFAPLENAGATRRPLAPVHPRAATAPDGSLQLFWTRRSRGAWGWPDEVETPLIEQGEGYRVGIGPVLSPGATWTVQTPSLIIPQALLAQLTTANPGADIWVRQIGSYAQSDALLIGVLS
ncbi:phage tail protein [Allopontixanthobacter sp.]|uniref:phage tail protein n=1 Tax=Allopontixanthobacter sp. TaxID=2906452 RepID=UPI002ABACF48|nr:phage tail protein [Allopontixanthobacter sp.]MDZ4308366.1 phage tail protein [Allopontixanthobacter sp.]